MNQDKIKNEILIGLMDDLEMFQVDQFISGRWRVKLEKKDGTSIIVPFRDKTECIDAVRRAWS